MKYPENVGTNCDLITNVWKNWLRPVVLCVFLRETLGYKITQGLLGRHRVIQRLSLLSKKIQLSLVGMQLDFEVRLNKVTGCND